MKTPHGAREAVRATVEADPFATLEELRQAGKRKAKAEAQAFHLEAMRKIVLSRISSEIASVQSNAKLSEAKLERLARADPRYETHIKGLSAAIEEKEDAHAAFWTLKSELEWMDRTAMMAMSLAKLER
jgi:hypothetical protein